jgi:hypothetical protein
LTPELAAVPSLLASGKGSILGQPGSSDFTACDHFLHVSRTYPKQRQKLSEAQKAYVAADPRWAMHRQKLADAQTARRMTLSPDEFEMVLAMRSKGRPFSYIQEEIGVCHDVIRRALAEGGHSTAPIKKERRAKRGSGFWSSRD